MMNSARVVSAPTQFGAWISLRKDTSAQALNERFFCARDMVGRAGALSSAPFLVDGKANPARLISVGLASDGDGKSPLLPEDIHMSTQLIPIASRTIQGKPTETVHARKLHALLNVKSKYADWIRNRIALGFIENKDYISLSKKIEGNNANKSEHYLNLDMAKHIAMMERNEMGGKARDYFIECERKVKEQPAQLSLAFSQTIANYIDHSRQDGERGQKPSRGLSAEVGERGAYG